MIVYKLLPDGGFVVGDTETRLTRYSYPTSINAEAAKKNPKKIAEEMLSRERFRFDRMEYDARNWTKLEEEKS